MMEKEHVHKQRLKLIDFLYKDVSEQSVSQIKDEIKSFYTVYNNTVANLGNCTVFRVRKIEGSDIHNSLKDVWCPLPEYVTKLGRANDKGETMFYGALDPETAIIETKISLGDKFSLAMYKLSALAEYNQSSIIIKESSCTRKNPTEFELFGNELSKFMVKEFTQQVDTEEEHKYAKTCAMSKILLELPNKDSILYPSVQNEDTINIVMNETNAKERLSLDNVLTCKMEIVNGKQQITVTEVKKISQDGVTLYKENHDYLPCPFDIQENSMRFSKLFHDDKTQSYEDIFNERMRRARESTT